MDDQIDIDTQSELRECGSVYIKLVRAAETVSAKVHAHLPEHNLTLSQFAVLEALYSLGPMFQKSLGTKILKSSGNMTLVIDNLVKKNLVFRKRSTEDRRFMIIDLTDTGRQSIRSILPHHLERIREQMMVLTEEERHELGRLCRKAGLGLSDAQDGEGMEP